MNLRNAFGRAGAGRPLTEDEPLSEALKIMLPALMRNFIEERAYKQGVTLGAAAREILNAGIEAVKAEGRGRVEAAGDPPT